MRSVLEALDYDLAEIRAMASAITPINNILADSSDEQVRAYLSVRRRFDYSALIVALYACYERFVEDILGMYVGIIADKCLYGELPTRLQTKHLIKTGELLSKAELDQYRYPGVTSRQLAENLHLCLSGNGPYQLNHFAVTAHDKNIRYDELTKLLGVVEINPDTVRHAEPLLDWYCEDQKLIGERPPSVPLTTISGRLEDLVERRNDIAHRGGNPANRLGVAEMQALIDFVQALSKAIFIAFVAQYFQARYKNLLYGDAERLQLNEGPYSAQRVWVVDGTKFRLRVGQPVFALSKSFVARWGRIEELQVDGVSRPAVEAGDAAAVGVRFPFAAPESAEIYILNTDDTLVWPS